MGSPHVHSGTSRTLSLPGGDKQAAGKHPKPRHQNGDPYELITHD
jgi:hypothetical protein